jgi:hypothetical protein
MTTHFRENASSVLEAMQPCCNAAMQNQTFTSGHGSRHVPHKTRADQMSQHKERGR